MSFCRWSSMNYGCDLYCYESLDGFVTHVADVRVVGVVPIVDDTLLREYSVKNSEEWLVQSRVQHNFLETAKYKSIGLPYDGQTFTDYSNESFLNTLAHLRDVGYTFPDITEEDLQ